MAKVNNNFIKGKMNKDLDDRLIPVGEYRNAINAQVSRSEGPNVGALENVLGNTRVSDLRTISSISDGFTIGYCTDEINNRVFVFITNNTVSKYDPAKKHAILVYSGITNATTLLVQGAFLNFSTLNPITGVNILENLLYFTDNRNQPRVINVDDANPTSSTTPSYYTTEDQISVAKYNPYKAIELYRISSDINPTGSFPDGSSLNYETTMFDVVSKYYPDGGLGTLNANITSGDTTMQILKANYQGDLIPGATIAFIDTTSPGTFTPGLSVNGTPLTISAVGNTTNYWTVTAGFGDGGIPAYTAANTEVVFNYNNYYDITYNGDADFLNDKFIRFAYRFKYIDGEYSIISPFTQECFIPKQDGYFMYKRNPIPNGTPPDFGNLVNTSPELNIQDEEDTFRTTTVDFMENKVNKIILRIPLPTTSNVLARDLKVTEVDILFKESTSNNIRVVENVEVSQLLNQEARATTNGAVSNSETITVDAVSAPIKQGMLVTGAGIVNNPRVVSFNGTTQVVLTSKQTIANNVDLTFGQLTHFEYEYQSTKPYKVLPLSETTRTYDKVPVKALSQEIISNRVVYGNFLDKHTPPSSLDYNVAVSQKLDFNLGTGTATTNGVANSGVTTINTNTVSGSIENGYVVTANVSGIPNDTVVVSFTATSVTISAATTQSIANASVLTFTAPSSVRWNTSTVEYPNSSLKQNRNYQVGIVLSDKFGRSSSVILSDENNSVTFGNQKYLGSTVFSDYLKGDVEALEFPGNSLKILFNNTIPGGATGIYNGDSTSADYNPLGWYSYKVVVKQTEQEYYNVYLPGIMAAYPNEPLKELGKTSHAVLFNDNINKVPRDLVEVGPEQKQFRSSVTLNGRVQNTNTQDVWQNNIQYYPGAFPSLVSVIATDDDLFNGISEIGYVGSPDFYNVNSNPLIARINTPSKQLGVTATPTTATVDANTTGLSSDQVNITISTISPIFTLGGNPAPGNSLFAGQTVTGNGVPDNTTIITSIGNGSVWKLTFSNNLEGTSSGDVLTFTPTNDNINFDWVTIPNNLSIMETDPVESDLDIFWETTTEGLITELNQAVLGGTADAVSISGFNTDLFKESLAPNGNMFTTPFSLLDQFSNTIVYANTTPPQLQLNSVYDFNGNLVDDQNPSELFELEHVSSTNTYQIKTKVPFYYSNQAATNQTYRFDFEVNYNGTQNFITQQPVSLINVAPDITSGCTNSTYIPGTSGGGNGTITNLQGLNGASTLNVGFDEIAWKDLSWSIVVTGTGSTTYNPPTGVILLDQSKVNKFWNGRVYFAGGDPPSTMPDGTYTVSVTLQDAGALTDTCSFVLTLDRTPCFTYKFTYTGSGNTIGATYTGCSGESEVVSFVDPPSNTFPGYTTACAPDNTTALTNAGFVKLALDSTDPANVCNT